MAHRLHLGPSFVGKAVSAYSRFAPVQARSALMRMHTRGRDDRFDRNLFLRGIGDGRIQIPDLLGLYAECFELLLGNWREVESRGVNGICRMTRSEVEKLFADDLPRYLAATQRQLQPGMTAYEGFLRMKAHHPFALQRIFQAALRDVARLALGKTIAAGYKIIGEKEEQKIRPARSVN